MSTKFNIARPLQLATNMVINRQQLDGRRKFRLLINLVDVEGRNYHVLTTSTTLSGIKNIPEWTPVSSIKMKAKPMAWTVVIDHPATEVLTVRTVPFKPLQPIRK